MTKFPSCAKEFIEFKPKDSNLIETQEANISRIHFKKRVLSICQKQLWVWGHSREQEVKTPALMELKFYWRVHEQGFLMSQW